MINKERTILLDPATTAGGGGTNKTENIAESLTESGQKFNIVSINPIIGRQPDVYIEFPEQAGIEDNYEAIETAVDIQLTELTQRGYSKFKIISRGYAAYGPQAVKSAVKDLNTSGIACEATVWVVDSSFPDIDSLDENTSGRFYSEAYFSDEYTRVVMAINNGLVVPDYEVFPRRFGMEVIAVGQPMSEQYRSMLLERRGRDRKIKRESSLKILEEVNGAIPQEFWDDGLMIPIIANDVVFASESAGLDEDLKSIEGKKGWMTKKEFLQASSRLVEVVWALSQIAETEDKRIIIPLTPAAKEIIERDLKQLSDCILVVSAPPLMEEFKYLDYLLGVDLAISRSTQAVTTIQLTMMGVPTVICPMPGNSYMDSYLVDPLVEGKDVTYLDPSLTKSGIYRRLLKLVSVPGELTALGFRGMQAADLVSESNELDFINIIINS